MTKPDKMAQRYVFLMWTMVRRGERLKRESLTKVSMSL
jgi:hypothetical protein